MTYNNSIIRRAEKILGYGISCQSGAREFIPICNTIYVDIFTGDVEIDNYDGTIKKAFNGKVGGTTFFNEIIIDKPIFGPVSLNLSWGSNDFLAEIDDLLSYLSDDSFDMEDAELSSKKIEDFSISYRSSDDSTSNKNRIIDEQFSFYIRRPMIIDISREKRHDERYF